ncbi:MAG: type II toxin-antitoxin system VapC family toxin [Actinomycetales bacterium]|nr:type II toxin-antitoxin system VapC family toxin [Actinomycetales bacterium]
MIVVDASTVVAALIDAGPTGRWASHVLRSDALAAPHLLPAEVSNILRRASLLRDLSTDTATLARSEFDSLRLELFPFAPCSARIWELRENITAYDAWYVALAESLDTTLATLDTRLSRAPGPRCAFLVADQ